MKPDRIEALIAKWEPTLKSAFIEAIRDLRSAVSASDLVRLIKAGDVEGAIRAVGLDPAAFRKLDLAITATFDAGGVDATLGIKPTRSALGLTITPLWDVRAPAADRYIRDYTASLITQITEDQRQLVRSVLAPIQSGQDPILTGNTPEKLALDLVGRVSRQTGKREGGLLGLTTQQATWARNYEIELGDVQAGVPPDANALTRKLRDRRFDATIRKAIKEGRPIPADTRRAMVANYRNRALRYRAETIAFNEASTVLHASQIEAWQQAVLRGAVTEDRVRRFWLTSADERVRASHRAIPGMNEGGVGLHQPFQTPHGPTLQPGWSFEPGCRCRVRVRVLETAA